MDIRQITVRRDMANAQHPAGCLESNDSARNIPMPSETKNRRNFKMSNSNFCRCAVVISCGLAFLFLIECISLAHKNEMSVSNDIVSANIKDMPLVEVLALLDVALQKDNSRYSVYVYNTKFWNGTRVEIKSPFTRQEERITVSNMPRISFSSKFCSLESFLEELKNQSKWSMQLHHTNDIFVISGGPVQDVF